MSEGLSYIRYLHLSLTIGKVTPIGYGVEVREFADLILNCKLCFKLGAKFNFTWSKIAGELPQERAYQTGCALVVSNATMNDTGKYLCSGRSVDRVSDESIRAILEVTVIGKNLNITKLSVT